MTKFIDNTKKDTKSKKETTFEYFISMNPPELKTPKVPPIKWDNVEILGCVDTDYFLFKAWDNIFPEKLGFYIGTKGDFSGPGLNAARLTQAANVNVLYQNAGVFILQIEPPDDTN